MDRKRYFISSYLSHIGTSTMFDLESVADRDIRAAIVHVSPEPEGWVCIHDDKKLALSFRSRLSEVARARYSRNINRAARDLRDDLKKMGLGLVEELGRLRAIPDLSSREKAMDAYVADVMGFEKHWMANKGLQP